MAVDAFLIAPHISNHVTPTTNALKKTNSDVIKEKASHSNVKNSS